MSDLRQAAQQALDWLERDRPFSIDEAHRVEEILRRALRAALAEPVQHGCDHCNQPLYAAVKCRVCGRVTSAEPVQEPPQ